MDLGKLRTDLDEGTWITFDSETSFKLASNISERYKAAAKKFYRPYANLIDSVGLEAIPEADQKSVAVRILASAILDWKGLKDGGIEVPYSPEKAVEVLSQVPRCFQWVQAETARVENFRSKTEGVEAKNSEPASAGA